MPWVAPCSSHFGSQEVFLKAASFRPLASPPAKPLWPWTACWIEAQMVRSSYGSMKSHKSRSMPSGTVKLGFIVTSYKHAFVVMPNHVHLLVTPNVTANHWLGPLKGFTAHEANRVLGRHAPFWQDESYDRLVRNGEEFQQIQRYIAGTLSLVKRWRAQRNAGQKPGGRLESLTPRTRTTSSRCRVAGSIPPPVPGSRPACVPFRRCEPGRRSPRRASGASALPASRAAAAPSG